MMTFLLTVLTVLAVISFFTILFWVIHITQVNEFTRVNGWAGYIKFKKEFNKVNWNRQDRYKHSLFDDFNDNSYHAGIIEFNSIGMKINNPFSYLLVMIYAYRYIKKHHSYEKYKW